MPAPADNYIISRDASEADRLALQHEYFLSCQGYYLHPDITLPTTSARIAEVCTGTGIWLREVADSLPTVECHGFDISDKMYPPAAELPANVTLHIADVKAPFAEQWLGYFDVVHVRFIMAAMRRDEWGPVVRNLTTLLRPGGWLQWVEDDRAHAVRHAARAVAPLGAAKNSLKNWSKPDQGGAVFVPPKLQHMARFTGTLMGNERADDMTYGYMNLHTIMRDPQFGGLQQVGCDVFVIDRADDGGQLRRDWAAMGIAAVCSLLKAREEAGDDKLTDITREQLTEGFLKDIEKGGHFVARACVVTGQKKA